MEVSYHREMKKNYLMIEADEGGMQQKCWWAMRLKGC